MFGRKAPSNPSISLNKPEEMPSFPVLPVLPKEKPIAIKKYPKQEEVDEILDAVDEPEEFSEEEQEQEEEPQEVQKPVAKQVKQEVKQQEEPQQVQVQEEDADLQMLYNHEARLQAIEAALFRIKQAI